MPPRLFRCVASPSSLEIVLSSSRRCFDLRALGPASAAAVSPAVQNLPSVTLVSQARFRSSSTGPLHQTVRELIPGRFSASDPGQRNPSFQLDSRSEITPFGEPEAKNFTNVDRLFAVKNSPKRPPKYVRIPPRMAIVNANDLPYLLVCP